jgi:hypothetical protein
MKLPRPLPRSRKVWLCMTVLVFIGAWFIPSAEGVDGRMPVGAIWYAFITRSYTGSPSGILMMLALLTCCFALVAVVVGWLLQFPICLVWKYFHRGRRNKPSAS